MTVLIPKLKYGIVPLNHWMMVFWTHILSLPVEVTVFVLLTVLQQKLCPNITPRISGGERKLLLVTGGSKGILYFIDYAKNVCIFEYQLKFKRNVHVNTLCFHPTDHGILFCGTSNGEIRICELKKYLKEPNKVDLVINNCISIENEVFDFAFCLNTKLLLCSSSDNIMSFFLPSREIVRSSSERKGIKIKLVCEGNNTSKLVDSVKVLKDGLIACKYALHSCIYICDLKPLRDALDENNDIHSFELEPLHILKWSSTDNYFMYMGVNIKSSLLCCGDDNGSLWLYDLQEIFESTPATIKRNIDPSAIIPWPNLTDHYNDKKRKLNLNVYDIVIDKVVVHSSSEFIVAVTNNNLVCIWKKT
ncbi:leucine-rich repeat and WD repeat-containing protein 1 isoform X2 [Halyomorpha halys]|uniref:leucine-rich repeat and WD repeat-containing protein 1 isoform X2 n=1 Tax=Halyomorpha halys TaxID=286706 RepID=UPI0006D4DE30|nr:leucine-rich repeat and WD repeat-containing protein 1-like isoform X2 [Halyomorpha halys]